jgi:AAA+ ATPase superfamily predicted ATPase
MDMIVGRKKELRLLQEKISSNAAEFIAVYGCRRVGKTYLIKHFFSRQSGIFFEQTGINNGTMHEQLHIFLKV